MINPANLITILSLLCGFVSIIFSLEEHFTFASWAIILSVIFDGLDGQIARKFHTATAFGKELDSLVDVVCFGIAPVVLGYIFLYKDFHFWATFALFIYLLCSVVRLAKYNITPKEEAGVYFCGLPTTMSGGVLASFILIYRRYTQSPPPGVFPLLVLALAVLMVSKVRYINLDGLTQRLKKSAWLAAFIVLAALAVLFIFYVLTSVLLWELIIFTLFALYLLFSPFLIKIFV